MACRQAAQTLAISEPYAYKDRKVELVRGLQMQTQAPAGGEPAAPAGTTPQQTGAQTAPPDGAVGAAAPAPELISTAALPALAAITLALVVFVFVIYFIARWRIGDRGVPAATSTRGRKGADQDFFQPAGEDAEITFDDEVPGESPAAAIVPPRPLPARKSIFAAGKSNREAPAPIEPAPSQDEFDANDGGLVIVDDGGGEPAQVEPPAPRAGLFGGLFGKRKQKSEAAEAHGPPLDLAEDETSVEIIREEPPPPRPSGAELSRSVFEREESDPQPRDDWRQRFDEERRLADERRSAEEREAEARRAAAEEELRRDMTRRAAEREAEFERRKLAASLEMRQLDIDARERALVERERAATRPPVQQFAVANDVKIEPAAAGGVEALLDEHRQQMSAAIQSIASRIDGLAGRDDNLRELKDDIAALKRAFGGRNARPAAPLVHLADIMRNALPADGYEMRASLGDNRRADCLVRLARPAGPIAIDARFPIEAFAALHAAPDGDVRAENEFRRVALRHIVDVAEKMIAPGVTGDSAILFLPSETMAAEMHARFPEIVEDGYRAKVWIVSPTSLMATLNAMRAVMREAPARAGDAGLAQTRLLSEIEELRRRVGLLESGGARPQAEAKASVPPPPPASPPASLVVRAAAHEAFAAERSAEPPREASAVRSGPAPSPAPREAEADQGPDLWEDRRSGDATRQPFPLR